MKKLYLFVILILPFILESNAQDIIPKIKWKFPTEASIRSGAVIYDGNLYFGNSNGTIYCLDKESGLPEWQYETGGAITASAAVTNSIVVVPSRDNFVYALETKSGKLKWKFEMGEILESLTGGWEYFSSAAIIKDDRIFIGSGDGHLYTLDASSGELKWKFKTNKRIRATPFVSGGKVYQPGNDGFVYVIDKNNGKLLWKFETEGASLDSKEFGFDRNSIFDQVNIVKDQLIFGSRDGNAYSVNLNSKKINWKFSYGPTWAMTTTVADNTVYIGWSTNNLVCALDLSTGKEKWKYKCGAQVYSKPLVVQNHLFIGSADGKLYKFKKGTGEKVWDYLIGSEIYSSPIHDNGVFYFGSDNGNFYALEEDIKPIKAVYQPGSIVGNAKFLIVDQKITPYLEEKGFEKLDSTGLYHFIKNRIQDGIPSVIVFSLPLIPQNMIGDNPSNGLIRKYLGSGGKILWMGDVPNYYAMDQNGNFKRDDLAGSKLLEVEYLNSRESGNYFSTATTTGRMWGLPKWLKTTASIVAPADDIVPLAIDEYNRISVWLKKFNPRPGSGFVSCRTWSWNVNIKDSELSLIHQLAIYGLE